MGHYSQLHVQVNVLLYGLIGQLSVTSDQGAKGSIPSLSYIVMGTWGNRTYGLIGQLSVTSDRRAMGSIPSGAVGIYYA